MAYSIFSALFLVFLGFLAAPQYVLSRNPESKGVIDSIHSYAPWIGLFAVLLGLWVLIQMIGFEYWLLRFHFLVWLTGFLSGVVLVGLGFLLGYPVVSQRLSQSAETAKRVEDVRAKVAPFQSLIAIVSIVLGVWTLFLLIFGRLA